MNAKDREHMSTAIELAKSDPRPHKVGAVVVKNDVVLGRAYGGKRSDIQHAEATVLESIVDVNGATLYTTLEPCTRRRHPHDPCAVIIKQRGISRVVIGIPDPNPAIKGSGEAFLHKHGIPVEYADHDQRDEIKLLMQPWFGEQEKQTIYAELFSKIGGLVSEDIRSFTGPALQSALTLRLCPDVMRGWLMREINIYHSTNIFPLPQDQMVDYKKYCDDVSEYQRLHLDDSKIMLSARPTAYSDSPDLSLETKETSYGHVQFYKDVVSQKAKERVSLIQELVTGRSTAISFPNTLCLHMIVVTDDKKLLITRRAPDMSWHPNLWSCSIEEQIASKDLAGDGSLAVERWGKRALLEELGLTEQSYLEANLRILSVFLEGDILNVSLCGMVDLNMSSEQLSRVIRGLPRMDYEFHAWDYLNYEDNELIGEILNPSPRMEYHPTSRYRMLMALIRKNGLPINAERFFRGGT